LAPLVPVRRSTGAPRLMSRVDCIAQSFLPKTPYRVHVYG